MNGIPDRLARAVINVAGEELDELLWHYPTPEEAGREDMPRVRLRHDDDHFGGIVLGYGTSFEESHTHMPGTRPPKRCSGCRWTDVTIMWAEPLEHEGEGAFKPTAPAMYAVLVRGRSILPGEEQRIRVTWTSDPAVVLDSLYVRVPRHLRVTGYERNITGPHEDALLDAASVDDGLAQVADDFVRSQARTSR